MVSYLRRFAFGQYRPGGKRCGLGWSAPLPTIFSGRPLTSESLSLPLPYGEPFLVRNIVLESLCIPHRILRSYDRASDCR